MFLHKKLPLLIFYLEGVLGGSRSKKQKKNNKAPEGPFFGPGAGPL